MTTSQSAGNAHPPFSDALFRALVAAITDACAAPWLIAALPDAESATEEPEPVRFNLTFDGSLQGECLLQFRRAEAITLASKCLRETATELGPEQSAALLKVVEKAIADFSAALASQYGAFTIHAALASQPPSDTADVAEMTAGDDNGNRASILMFLNPVLNQALTSHSASGAGAQEPAPPAANHEVWAAPDAVNLGLVMDVELNVTLRFGQRQLALREVLELTSGSVIELDRQVEEPVELLLEGKVIARGEAVVIDGNYGLRVTEVPQAASSPVRR